MTVVLITGCSSGFGEVAALALARAGVSVAAGCRDTSKAQSLAATARNEGLRLTLVTIDVRDEASVKACVMIVIGGILKGSVVSTMWNG